jgi:Zn-dependent protease with chaperone function
MEHGRRLSIVGVIMLVLCGASARGALGRDAVVEERIRAELAARAPQAVAGFDAATEALDRSDWTTAASRYREVLAAAPEFTPALRRLGAALIALDRYSEGLALTERALEIQRSPENMASLALALTRAPSKRLPPSSASLKRAAALAREAALAQPGDATHAALWAQAALQSDDSAGFREALAQLRARQPDHVLTHYFSAVEAATSGDAVEAEREIREAERRGLPSGVVQEFLASGVGRRASVWHWSRVLGLATAAWMLGLLALFVIGKALSAKTLAALDADDPSQELSPSTRRLRASYGRLVSLAGTYWYLSQPFVALLVIALAGSLFYGFMMIGRIPIKLAAIVAIGVLVTLHALVRSLFVRIRDDADPGRGISEQEAPGLWALTREVAREVGTRPIDEIWLTPGTDLAVFERGSMKERMRDRARRALLLGGGILEGLDRRALRAVLAHEYGHFSHRDTAGGDVAIRVRTGMHLFALALARSGYAVWWNVAFQFLRLYDFIFRRISHGATRLQEVLADRTAIRLYSCPRALRMPDPGTGNVAPCVAVFCPSGNAASQDLTQVCRPAGSSRPADGYARRPATTAVHSTYFRTEGAATPCGRTAAIRAFRL